MTASGRVWTSTQVHTRESADVDVWSGRASTQFLKAADSLRVDVWTVWTP